MLANMIALCTIPTSLFVLSLCLAAVAWISTREGIVNRETTLAAWHSRLDGIAGNHTEVAGVLAGFSITVVVLIAALSQETRLLHDVGLGTFVVAFFGYIATGLMFSLVPEREDNHSYFLFSMGSFLYFLSVLLGFVALMPFLEIIGYRSLRIGLFILVIGAFFAGYLAASIPLFDLFRLRRKVLALILVAAVSASFLWIAIAYGLLMLTEGGLVLTLGLAIPITVIVASFAFSMMTFFFPSLASEKTLIRVIVLVAIACTSAILQIFGTILVLLALNR